MSNLETKLAEAPHLFEFWWERYMPNATQAEAWEAWLAAPRADGVGVVAQAQQAEPLTVPHPGSPEASAMIDSELELRGWPANHKNAARAGYEACRKLIGAGIGANSGGGNG